MRHFLVLVPAVALCPVTALPRIIDYDSSVSCTAEVGGVLVTETGTTSCHVGFAHGETGYDKPSPEAVHGFVDGHARRPDTSAVTASLTVTEEFFSAGPPRDGIALVYLITEHYDWRGGTATVTVTDLTYGTQMLSDCTGYYYRGACLSWNPYGLPIPGLNGPTPIRFRLGEPFQTEVSLALDISAADGDTFVGEFLSASARVSLFEADGVTPVAILETPEPGMVPCMVMVCVVLWRARRCRLSRQPHPASVRRSGGNFRRLGDNSPLFSKSTLVTSATISEGT